jgi:hypothetical protein
VIIGKSRKMIIEYQMGVDLESRLDIFKRVG